MSAAVTTLLSELWLSFASLLRSYAAAASLNGGQAAEVAAGVDAVSIVCGPAVLDMHCDAHTGAGNWQLRRGVQLLQDGRFALLPEGRIALNEHILDLDHAAIDFIAVLTQAAGQEAR